MEKEESRNIKCDQCEEMQIGTKMRILELKKKGDRDKALHDVPKAHQRREDDRFH
jgi:hypothetical protein